jgi:hypothetical protein
MALLFLTLLSLDPVPERISPRIEQVFLSQDVAAFRALCDPSTRVEVDLRPMQFDRGFLSRDQTTLSFQRFTRVFDTLSARVTEQKTDTNFARLEMHLLLELKHRKHGHQQQARMVLQFKLKADHVVMIRWLLQKIH